MMSPAVGSSMRVIRRTSVDLPQPDSPTRPTLSPSPIAKLTSSTACSSARLPTGKCFFTSTQSSMFIAG
jgi:hypothetical protein